MNPFMMMFGPMGFGFMGGGCGCGVNMPYYGQNDMCTFMNFPVFRNTSMDYMLDPRLAMMQSQQSWMNGSGNIFGNNYLPLFNNFPGVNSNWTLPWMQPKAETDDDRKKREAREAEDKKPENIEKKAKIDSYKTYLERFKANLDEDGKKDFKVVEDKLNEILKEEKVDDRLNKVEELFRETFTPEALTKIALSDTEIDSKLYKIGYNFPSGISKHEPNEQEKIINKLVLELNLSDPLSVGEFASAIHGGEEYILQVISSWNDKHNEKGILRGLAKHIPDGDQNDKQVHYDECVEKFTNALKAKADKFMEDNGGAVKFPNLSAQYKLVEEMFSNYDKTASASYKQSKINKLAYECDKLYAMLRVQEAVLLNKKVVNKYAEKMNAIHSNAIPKDIIVKETLQDLEKENIEVPSSEDLDEIPEQDRGFRVSREKTSMEEIDEIEDAKERIKALVEGNNKKLKAVKGREGICETRTEKEETNAPKRYYTVLDNGIAEAKLDSDENEYVIIEGKENVSAVEIGQYTDTVQNIDRYYRAGKIIKSQYVDGVYLSAAIRPNGHSEHFIIKNNKLVKVKGYIDKDGNVKLDNGTTTTIDKLTDADVTEVTSESDIYTKQNHNQDSNFTKELTNDNISKYSDINRKKLNDLNLEYTGVDGWYKLSNGGKIGYYKYNADNNKFEYQSDVKEIKDDGTYIDKNGKMHLCQQADSPEVYAKQLNKALFVYTTDKQEKSALRCLHTLLSYTKPDDVAAFLKAYNESASWYESGLCAAIYEEMGCFTDKIERDGQEYRYKEYFVERIAEQLLLVANETNIDQDVIDDIKTIANGERCVWYRSNPRKLDSLIKEVLEEYESKNNKTED